jgi:enamine deaminase RidA (YjgF/YER057c/UK114 family)
MSRRYSWPNGHWNWPIKVTHKHGLRCGKLIFTGGQVDLDTGGNVCHPGDLYAQTDAAIRYIHAILADLGAGPSDVVKLQAFYVNDGGIDETTFFERMAKGFPGSQGLTVNLVPLPRLAYPGLAVEIEAVAMLGEEGRALARTVANPAGLARLPAPFVHGTRCGEMVFLSGQSPRDRAGKAVHAGDIVAQSRFVMDNIGGILASLGAGFDDVVKLNRWYTGQGTREDWQPAALAVAERFAEPGPTATGIPLPRLENGDERIRIDVLAMLGEDGARLDRTHVWPAGHWDWPVHLPYKHGLRCGDMVFVGGQVALDDKGAVLEPGALAAQTRISMENIRRVLAGFGLDMDSVVKVLALYSAAGRAEELHTNLSIRSAAYSEPGPTSTGIPLPCLAYRDMMIEIEIIAMGI